MNVRYNLTYNDKIASRALAMTITTDSRQKLSGMTGEWLLARTAERKDALMDVR